MDYSFYGGRKGSSFVLAASFSSIEEMKESFQKGPAYTAVNFDEYVIINTPNKRSQHNGKIFKRGYEFNDENAGAIYIGKIVGAEGPAPLTQLKTIDEINQLHEKQGLTEEEDGYIKESFSKETLSQILVPGKNENGIFNDEVEWASCNIVDPNNEKITAVIGFKIPYLITEFESELYPIYNEKGQYEIEPSKLIQRKDDKTHPFYQKWSLKIPKGIQGDSFKNFRIIEANDSIQNDPNLEDDISNKRQILVYDYYKYNNREDGEPVSIYLGDYNMIKECSVDDEGSFTIDYTHNDSQTFTKKIKWINSVTLDNQTGSFNIHYNNGTPDYNTTLEWINKVNVTPDGTIDFTYNTGTLAKTFEKKLQWIDTISVDPNGQIKIKYNNKENEIILPETITWIKDILLDDSGTLTIDFNDKTTSKVFDKKLKWINNIFMSNTGIITVQYNTGESQELNDKAGSEIHQVLKWIKNIALKDDGTLTVNYNNNTKDEWLKKIRWITKTSLNKDGHFIMEFNDGTPAVQETLKWITECSFTDLGDFKLVFNTGETITKHLRWIDQLQFDEQGNFSLKMNDEEAALINHQIKWIKDLKIDTGASEGEGSQRVQVKFNDTNNFTNIGNPLNYIMATAINPENSHLLVLYSDPEKRQKIPESQKATYSYQNIIRTDWLDLGCIRSYNGILIGKNLNNSYFTTEKTLEEKINKLNQDYPQGLTELEYQGKILTVGDTEENKLFFAFDYQKRSWYYLGSFGEISKPEFFVGKESDVNIQDQFNAAPENSILFIIEEEKNV